MAKKAGNQTVPVVPVLSEEQQLHKNCARLSVIFAEKKTLDDEQKALVNDISGYISRNHEKVFAEKASAIVEGVRVKKTVSVKPAIVDAQLFAWDDLMAYKPDFVKSSLDNTAVKNYINRDAVCAAQM